MSQQYLRSASLLVLNGTRALDLSQLQFTFHAAQQDVESPNNCAIRVFNLSHQTARLVQDEFSTVVVQAGYGSGPPAEVFRGDIKQFRRGRLNATDTYLDILAADGDKAYNFAVVNKSLSAASTPAQRFGVLAAAMAAQGVATGYVMPFAGGVLPRGKVLFGMARAQVRTLAASQGASWGIDGGRLNVVPLDGYLPGQAVVLTAQTGLVGLPEQTEGGVRARCLLNPRVVVGGLVQIDNASVNQLLQQNPAAAPVAYNQYTGVQNLAQVSTDGLYRVFVAEHSGDTRGSEWYTDLTCLAVNPQTQQVADYG